MNTDKPCLLQKNKMYIKQKILCFFSAILLLVVVQGCALKCQKGFTLSYFGSNADSGWGAWSIEVGWTQAWIPAVLTMRELNKNLWDISKESNVNRHFELIRNQMIPDNALMSAK